MKNMEQKEEKMSERASHQNAGLIKIARASMVGISVMVFLGYIMMWCIMPTDTYYNKWVPHIMADTNSTYFGLQGPIILDFTFPILFIAVLGCFYTYLGKRMDANEVSCCKTNDSFKFLKKPMIIKALGVVTWIELFFFGMFILLTLWYFSAYMHFWYEKISMVAMSRGDKVWQAKLERLALVIGLAGNVALTFLFVPVTRGSSILAFLGLSSEASIKYHMWLGNIAMALFTAHGTLYIIYWGLTDRLSEMLKWDETWDQTYVNNIAGELCLLCGLIMWSTTFPRIRRTMFELFYYTHHLYILFIIFYILHKGLFFICIMLPGMYLFVIDRFLRFLQSRQNVRLVSARVLPCEAVELNFSKSRALEYTTTSTMFVNIPIVSKLQWHPFTVVSNSSLEPDTLSVVIKCEGSWTKKLYDVVSSPSSIDHRLQVAVEGPYGPPTTHFLRHDTLVMISGGSGITPMISIIRDLIFMSSEQKCKTPKLVLVSTFKNTSHLSMLDLLLPLSSTPSKSYNLDLEIEAYITRENTQPTEKSEPIRTIHFKPLPSDIPIASSLGRYSWLWLAAIISSSFIIFLLISGIYTNYYIYPKDLNMMRIDLMTRRTVFTIFLIFFSIAVTSTAAFLWNKKQNARETKQIQDLDEWTKGKSFSAQNDNADRELESLPYQSLVKTMKVHYGSRPDLNSKHIITLCLLCTTPIP
ncbi:OLC1v1000050C2 [Oldenlandia corymbosa var. corymbosa]|uniref:ferric-chelate reductase (NADH) n=1 Tax=Oldenlandia corymbosa var. corymbosa TaxID=529605 RepID=A0AAV1D2V9_OLDCO|nr:OLC1v1000050C2 [Oldenlandia corymbosa var. corymbosa]